MKKDVGIILVVGFSLFAMFFGAGNLIFPTYLGYTSGTYWPIAFLIYIIADGFLAMISLYFVFSCGGIEEFVKPLGKKIGTIMLIFISLCIGPLVAIPRTGAITFELGVSNFNFNNLYITTAVFFICAYFICIKSEKIVDFIGRYLTPILLSFLMVMVITGIFYPVGEIAKGEDVSKIMYNSFVSGFQTLDGVGALMFSAVVISSLSFYKIEKEKEKKIIFSSSLVALLCLAVVYGGLCYLGATSQSNISNATEGSVVLISFTRILFGSSGVIILSVIVILACLTTAVALIGGVAEFFYKLIPSISYKMAVFIISFISYIFSCLGVAAIIKLAVPLLFTLYPPIIVLIITYEFRKKINCSNAIKYSVIFSAIFGAITVINDNFKIFGFINKFPLSSVGLGYLIPSLIVFVIMAIFEKNSLSNGFNKEKLIITKISLYESDIKMLEVLSDNINVSKTEIIRKAIKNLYTEIKDKD